MRRKQNGRIHSSTYLPLKSGIIVHVMCNTDLFQITCFLKVKWSKFLLKKCIGIFNIASAGYLYFFYLYLSNLSNRELTIFDPVYTKICKCMDFMGCLFINKTDIKYMVTYLYIHTYMQFPLFPKKNHIFFLKDTATNQLF